MSEISRKGKSGEDGERLSPSWEERQKNLWPQDQSLLQRPGCPLTVGPSVSLVS